MKESASLQEFYRQKFSLQVMIDSCPSLDALYERAERIVDVPTANVLIVGETGTGKDTLAQCIHYNSAHWREPFVEINCAALPATLLESELFGYEDGAFTGAKGRKRGLLEVAGSGTVFLNEIAEMAIELQPKLLSVIDRRVFFRVGGTQPVEFNARLIAATNRSIQDAIENERLRQDLYFRLNTIQFVLPPLRERPEDIPPLAERLVAEMSKIHRREPPRKLSCEAMQRLRAYSWPGNVRELKQVLERAVILSHTDKIQPEDVMMDGVTGLVSTPGVRIGVSGEICIEMPPEGIAWEKVERAMLEAAMKAAGGVQAQAARLLHISRDTLRYRLQKYNLDGAKLEDFIQP